MKKLIIALTVSTFALTGALHAADTKVAADKGGCCDKTAATAKAGGSCCGEKTACSKSISRKSAMSPKAMDLAMH